MNDTYNAPPSGQSIYYNTSNATNTGAANNANTSNPSNSPNPNQNTTATNAAAAATQPSNTATSSTGNSLISDVYAQLTQLNNHFINYQNTNNEKINELNLKVNYMSDSLESMKQNLNNVNQQVLLILQNPTLVTGSNSSSANFYNSQNKVLELFHKHLANLGKEIEDLSMNPNVSTHHPQLQSQQHLNPQIHPPQAALTQPRNTSASATAGTGYTEEEVDDLSRPPFSKTIPASVSNPTSPFIANRFNFDINSFPSTRSANSGFLQPSTQQQQQQHQSFHAITDIGLSSNMRSNSHDDEHEKRKRRKSSKSKQDQHPGSSYILPLPVITNEDEPTTQQSSKTGHSSSKYVTTPSLPSNNPGTQFIAVNSANEGDVLTPGSRHQSQSRTNYFASDIDLNENGQSAISQPSNSSSSNNNDEDTTDENKKRSKSGKKLDLKQGGSTEINVDDLPRYKLERSLKTISDIWKEYEYGVNDKPPLRLLEIKYGTKWRNETESRTFLRRKKIYEAIEAGKSKGFTEDQIINDLEEYRSYENNGNTKKKPLSWLCSNVPEKYIA